MLVQVYALPIRTATKNLKVKMDRKIIYVQNIKKKTPGNH